MRKAWAIMIVLLALWGQSFGCATSDLIAAWSAAGGPSPPTILSRPTTQCDWMTPDGLFHIHYDTSGNAAVYHPYEDINPSDGIPDYVNRTADYFDQAYRALVEGVGFDPPPFDHGDGGDSLYDVYLTEVPGLTSPEYPSEQYPGRQAYVSFIQLGHDLRIPRYGDDPYPFLKASVAHEYFHAVEFAYRTYSADPTPWWFESCANWAEEIVFDSLNDVYYYLPAYLQNLHQSLYQTGGEFSYGAWLFPQYLAERMGSQFIRECWFEFAAFDFAITAIDFALREHAFLFNDEYCQHIVWNYFTGRNYHDGFYSEGALFGSTVYEARVHATYPVDWISAPVPLQNVAGSYIVFFPPQLDKAALFIDYMNRTDQKQAVCLAVISSFGSVDFNIYPVQSRILKTFTVRDFTAAEKVVLMPVWIFEGFPQDGITTYSYRAYIDTVATSANDAGLDPAGDFRLGDAYPNPFNGAVTISFNSPSTQGYGFRIYDIAGRLIYWRRDVSNAGFNVINWQAPQDLASGLLFYVISLQGKQLGGKVLMVK